MLLKYLNYVACVCTVLILCFVNLSSSYPANVSKIMLTIPNGEVHRWYPPILQVEPSRLLQILNDGNHIFHLDADLFNASFAETFQTFLVRINCVENLGEGTDFNLLNDTLSYAHEVNKMTTQKIQKIDIYLTLVLESHNETSYEDNLLRIEDLAKFSPGVITHVLLDLTSIDVGPLDGYSLLQKWKSCHDTGEAWNFTCGFIFDIRIFPQKISMFGFLQTAQSSPVYFNAEKFGIFATAYDRNIQMKAVHAVERSGLEFYGFLVNKRVVVSTNKFQIEWLDKSERNWFRIPTVYGVTFDTDLEWSTCYKNDLISYSNLSRNESSSAIISISSDELFTLLTTDANPIAVGSKESLSFLQLFNRFIVHFKTVKSDENNGMSPSKVFSAVYNFSVGNRETYHLRPFRLWIAFTPEGDIETELKAFGMRVAEINRKLSGTVEIVVLDYNHLRVDSAVKSVLQNDVLSCKAAGNEYGFRCGYILHERNCFRSKELLQSMPFANYSLLLLRGSGANMGLCADAFSNLKVGWLASPSSTEVIEVNFDKNTFEFNPAVLLWSQAWPFIIVPRLFRNDKQEVDTRFEPNMENWIHKPMQLSSFNVAFMIKLDDIQHKNLLEELTKQEKIFVRVTENVPQNFAGLCPDNSASCGAYQVTMVVEYTPKLFKNINWTNSLITSTNNLKTQCNGFVTGILIDWDPCYEITNCIPSNPLDYTADHFNGLSNITRTTALLDFLYVYLQNRTNANADEDAKKRMANFLTKFNVTEILEITSLFNSVVYELEYSFSKILENGPYQAAHEVLDELERFSNSMSLDPNQIWPRIRPNEQQIFKVSVSGCDAISLVNETVAYVRFWEILSNWAEKMDYVLIIDSAYSSGNEGKCKYSDDNNEKCGCGWWTMVGGQLLDRKSYARLLSNQQVAKPDDTYSQNVVIYSLLVAILFLFSIWIGILTTRLYRKRYVLSKQEARDLLANLKKNGDPVQDLTLDKIIGRGESKTFVWKGTMNVETTHMAVAVKGFIADQGVTLNREDKMAMKGLLAEASLLQELGTHKNIVNYYGVQAEKLRSGMVQVVLEFCSNGSLKDFLAGLRNSDTESHQYSNIDSHGVPNWTDAPFKMIQWCSQISSGLEYLTSKQIVHADVATRNILLDRELTCKICDFGLSRKMEKFKSYMKKGDESLPWRWMAPESLRKLVFNEKTDVWMYAITVWEIYTYGEVPYGGLAWNSEFSGLVEKGLRPEIPESMPEVMRTLVRTCWDVNFESRPSFSSIKDSILQSFPNIRQ